MFATSCGLFSDDQSDYEKVYNGLVMYFVVEQTNTKAMDGVNVAMRLAILLNEMESAGVEFDGDQEPDWSELGDVRYGGLDYNKKFFLFGSQNGVSISKDDDLYTIEYGTTSGSHSAGTGDMCYRLGEFEIDTSNNSNILNSSESDPWTLKISSDSISYASVKNSAIPYFECAEADTKLWYIGDGEFGYSVSNAAVIYVYYDDDPEDYNYSNWSISGTFTIDNFSALSVEDTIATDFMMNAVASGSSVSGDIYAYITTSPVIYNFLSGANLKYGGFEKVTLSDGRYVEVETASTGIQTIYYQGNSYAYDDEYYYYYYYENYNTVDDDDDDDE